VLEFKDKKPFFYMNVQKYREFYLADELNSNKYSPLEVKPLVLAGVEYYA